MLQLVSQQGNQPSLRPLHLDGNSQIPVSTSRDDMVLEISAEVPPPEFRLDVDNHIGFVQRSDEAAERSRAGKARVDEC